MAHAITTALAPSVNNDFELAMVRLAARIRSQRAQRAHYIAANPVMSIRERLAAARDALRECRDAVYGALRGWRID